MIKGRVAALTGVAAVLLTTAACNSSSQPEPAGPSIAPPSISATVPTLTPVPAPSSLITLSDRPHPKPRTTSHKPATSAPPTTPTTSAAPTTSSAAAPPSSHRPTVVIDPGHSVSVHGTDARTGLDVSDYENEPEMQDMFDVAVLVRRQLVADGYRVVLTKATADTPANLGVRADLANRLHADLALSIHDQAGSNGGIPFDSGNSIVYYQSVGTYRQNPQGKKIYFTDSKLAAISKRYGQIFQQQRAQAQGRSITLQGNTGYDLGSRGLQGGNIWIVQLLSRVPWIYNEAGGNSAGMAGLNAADKQTYANGLIKSVEACLPIRR